MGLEGKIQLRYPSELEHDLFFQFIKISELICELMISFDLLYNSVPICVCSSTSDARGRNKFKAVSVMSQRGAEKEVEIKMLGHACCIQIILEG